MLVRCDYGCSCDYVNVRVSGAALNFQFLIQSYFLYTALCLGISDNGRINLLTSNPNVIGAIPATKKEKEAAIKITHPITDDYNNNIVQCVELVQKPCGYVLRPAIINAAKQYYIILLYITV